MNLNLIIQKESGGRPRRERAVALVITLLMLSVITFLAVAFLAMTKRDRSAVSAALDIDTARTMSDAALARAQAEIMAQMMATNDILSYDYRASHNYIQPPTILPEYMAGNYGLTVDVTNVNYDSFITNAGKYSTADYVQNIANLFWDPRPPVFVTNIGNVSQPYDFRFWVDINRNGAFETNGLIPAFGPGGAPLATPTYVTVNGEPEWIGVLKYPWTNHSYTNIFIGRYAYLVQPIGLTLDWNFIYNNAQFAGSQERLSGGAAMTTDGFIRDSGVGSWELNLAALLNDVSPALYQTNPLFSFQLWQYNLPLNSFNPSSYQGNFGGAFNAAARILAGRYGNGSAGQFPQTLSQAFGFTDLPALLGGNLNAIDEYGAYPSTEYPFDNANPNFLNPNYPWSGTYNSNMFYDLQDFFNTSMIRSGGPGGFANNLSTVMSTAYPYGDVMNRYTFQRMLDCIGTSSAPEYGVYVYTNFYTTNITPNTAGYVPLPSPSQLRTKVNINYDNTAQILAGPYAKNAAGLPYGPFTPMPTNIVSWSAAGNNGLNFFTNAAESLLRSQIFVYTNWLPTGVNNSYVAPPPGSTYEFIYTNFGLSTGIPIYMTNQPGVVYNAQVHRMLQVAANIYAAAYSSNKPAAYGFANVNANVPQPPIYRPLFAWENYGNPKTAALMIVGYTNVSPTYAYNQLNGTLPFYDPGSYPNTGNWTPGMAPPTKQYNVWGIPWVVGAVTNTPQFDQFTYQNRIFFTRQLQFLRKQAGGPGQFYIGKGSIACTNQYYIFSVSNYTGLDAWNPYSNNFAGSSGNVYAVISNYTTIVITNGYHYRFVTNISRGYTTLDPTNLLYPTVTIPWQGYTGKLTQSNMFKRLLETNYAVLPFGYYSEYSNAFVPGNAATQTVNVLAGDTNQTRFQTHFWSVLTTNHVYYALFDGIPGSANANLLDFVNLGPLVTSNNITAYMASNGTYASQWIVTGATDAGNGRPSMGVLNQIGTASSLENQWLNEPQTTAAVQQSFNIPGVPPPSGSSQATLATPYENLLDSGDWMASDPLVHYTADDLYWGTSNPNYLSVSMTKLAVGEGGQPVGWSVPIGGVSMRYQNAIKNSIMLYGDPNMTSANNWNFPTNLLPNVGWLGRIHRGTPWQTIYLKPDEPNSTPGWYTPVTQNLPWVNNLYTYPTNDWSIIDLFTAVPNDNAARGLISVNQTNMAAWAAVFSGVIALTNQTGGIPISPTNDGYNFLSALNGSLLDPNSYGSGTAAPGITSAQYINPANSLNVVRAANSNGLFHRIGDILQVPALTTNSPYLSVTPQSQWTDEMVERIPQQTLGLMKLGLPQFVIYAWGQSLKPKNLYLGGGTLNNICTNYEITGEFLTRTVCHIVSVDGTTGKPQFVIDNFNIEPSN